MIWRCFKAQGKSSLLPEHTHTHTRRSPISSFTGLSLPIRLLSVSFYLSLIPSFFSLSWHPEMNRCCHRDSCSLSAFKQTVSKGITFTGNLPVWGEVIGIILLCPVRTGAGARPVTQVRNMTLCMWRPHASSPSQRSRLHIQNQTLLWITELIRLVAAMALFLPFVLGAENLICSGSLRL